MDIWTTDKFLLFFAFVIPGFISIKCYELLFPGPERSSSEKVIDAIAYSSMNYAILAYPIIAVEQSDVLSQNPWLYFVFYVFFLFGFPVLLVFLWRFLLTREFLQRVVPHPAGKPWDYVFAQRKPYWVKVTLKNGTVIAGKYAENSFASSAPADEQIYLEETWLVNERGGFERKKNSTAGVIILADDIPYVELRELLMK
jgi:hypothetical protein